MDKIRLQDLKLEDLLTLQKEKGKNYLKNMRILILNAEALGVLRKDLICTLGTERAKGFLIRYGYACGYTDAISTMRDFPLQNETDTYYLGLLFHTWVGMAHAIPEEVQCRKEKQKWFCTGTWSNSYEAEHHLKHFGPSTEPVCWTLTGYAGGFRTAYFGERVIYKEISCVAKGDPQCRFVGKTLGEWGDEILSDLPYYQETKLGEALEKAHARIQAQNEILKQSAAIHEQLTRMVLNGEEINAIAATLGCLIGGSVIVEDQFFRPIAHFSQEKGAFPAAPDFSVREMFTGPRFRSFVTAITQEKRTVFLSPEADGKPFFRLVAPIVTGHDILGYVSILKPKGGFTELDQMTLERATTVFALKIMQTRTIAEVENRLRGDFVEDLARGNFHSEASLIERARHLGHDLTQPHQVMIINIDNYSLLKDKFGGDEKQLLYLKGKLCEIASQTFQENGSSVLATSKSEDIIALAALKKSCPEVKELARKIQKKVTQQFPLVTVSVGIGRVCSAPGEIPLSYQEARRALAVAKGSKQKNAVISFAELGVYGLLFHAANQQDMLAFMQKELGPLLDYDARHKSLLTQTLQLYFEHDGRVKSAALAAAVTESGFKYRLNKIKEILKTDFKNPKKKFDLQMAIKIWQITCGGNQNENSCQE